jgi:tetratricopeptide (TPR) repeat protein
LNTGSLRIYRVNETREPAETIDENGNSSANGEEDEPHQSIGKFKPVDLLREEEKFSRKPVQHLAIIKEVGILVSLSDGYVSIHELQTYALQERLERTKGATSFAITSNIVKDPTSGIPDIVSRLAVAVKRRILIWSWQAMELSQDVTEITMSAAVKSLSWATGTRMVVGMDPGFFMVDAETKEVTDVIKPGALDEAGGQTGTRFGAVNSTGMSYVGMGGWVPKPMATRLGEGEMLLAKDVNTLFIDLEGKALDKRQVPWAQAPETVAYSYPYMLALQPPAKGGLEVRSPDTLSLLQTVPVPNANLLHVPQPNISLAHAGKGFLVASDRIVWRMGALDYESQIDVLTDQGRYDEAVSLLRMLEDTLLKDKEGRLREIQMVKAQSLFEMRKYHDALDLFSKAKAPPTRVISLYPRTIAGDLSKVKEEETEDDVAEDEKSDKTKSPPASPKVVPQSSIGRSMFGRLMAEQKKSDSDTASIKSGKAGEASDVTNPKNKSADASASDKALEGKDLDRAVNALFGFLAQSRVDLQKYLKPDGTLQQPLPPPGERPKDYRPPFFEYIQVDDDSEEEIGWQEKLLEVAKLVDTTLFRAYMLKQPRLIGSLFRINNFCDPLVVRDKLDETGRHAELIDFLHGKKLHREALEVLSRFGKNDSDAEISEDLRGPQRTIGYLQQLPPELIDIILEFAEWPLKVNPDEGMQIFLADTENAETLPRHRVLDFLQNIDNKLAVQYLEHIIFELNDLTPEFHQRLIDLYLDRLRSNKDGFASDEERLDWRTRLEKILKASAQYHRGRAFSRLPADDPDFYESRAIVLSKMGNHKQALQIYVFQIQDYEKAEEYCNEQYLLSTKSSANTTAASSGAGILTPSTDVMEDATSSPSIYHTLLSLYLQPPTPHKPAWPPALDLLSKHGARLPASSTLDIIPPTLPVLDLESYFRGRIRTANSSLNEERIVARLRGVEKARAEEKLVEKRGKGFRIDEERLCGVCHKRFGGSAIRVWPDGRVTHYGCLRASSGAGGKTERASVRRLFS